MSSFFQKPHTLADAVDKVARQTMGKDWGLYANLLSHWVDIIGTDYAHVTTPVKITFPYQPNEAQRKNGILTIRLPKGLAMEFSFKSDIIRRRINTYFGYEAFVRIVLDVAALPPMMPPPKLRALTAEEHSVIKAKTISIENNELRDVLERFGQTLLAQSAAQNTTK